MVSIVEYSVDHFAQCLHCTSFWMAHDNMGTVQHENSMTQEQYGARTVRCKNSMVQEQYETHHCIQHDAYNIQKVWRLVYIVPSVERYENPM